MVVSERIRAIARQISYASLADIGTDHAYIPLYAMAAGKIKRAIACDINPEPLCRAKANIELSGLCGIETRLGSGLKTLSPGEADTCVIAGMGGFLTVSILSESLNIVNGLKQLILQPQSVIPDVRKFVHSINFMIAYC